MILEKATKGSPATAGNTILTMRYWGLDLSGSTQSAGGVGGLLATIATKSNPATAVTETHYFHYDANGNVTETVDSNGDLTASYEYSPFGELVSETGSYVDENTYKFSTKPQDTETGFYYYGYRHYNPQIGRWLNKDPIGEVGFVLLTEDSEARITREQLLDKKDYFISLLISNFNSSIRNNEEYSEFIITHIETQYTLSLLDSFLLENTYLLREGFNRYVMINDDPINNFDLLGLMMLSSTYYAGNPPPPSTPISVASNLIGTPYYLKGMIFPPNWAFDPKCNKFVGDVLDAADTTQTPLVNGRYPTAAEWADPNVSIPEYSAPHNNPQPGDVVSSGAHVGIQTATGVIQAPTGKTVYNAPPSKWAPKTARTPIPVTE